MDYFTYFTDLFTKNYAIDIEQDLSRKIKIKKNKIKELEDKKRQKNESVINNNKDKIININELEEIKEKINKEKEELKELIKKENYWIKNKDRIRDYCNN